MRSFKQTITRARSQLENLNLETGGDVTLFVTEIQELKKNQQKWQNEMDKQKSGQKLLEKQRFKFPDDWLWVDQVESEWTAFK
jgi:dynein heavy chain 1